MNRHEQKQLLAEILAGDDLSDFRTASLQRGLMALRHRCRQRRALRVCSLACLLALVPCVFWFGKVRAPLQQRLAHREPPPLPVSPSVKEEIKLLTDEELFAL